MNSIQFYRPLAIVNGLVPLLVLGWDTYRGQLGANAVNYALHVTGILSLVFLFLSLSITPLRWLTGWGGWLAFRRSMGLFGFFYSVVHVAIYVGLDREMSALSTFQEIWRRQYLQVGTAAVFLMIPLAITSTNGMIQTLGPKKWKLLHRAAYVVAILGVVHYYMLVKSDVRQPIAFGIVLIGLFATRFGHHYFELKKNSNSLSIADRSQQKDGAKSRKFWSGALKLVATFQETPDVRTFRFASQTGDVLPFDYQPGQYMNLQLVIDGKKVNRSYTIASSPSGRYTCELTIKREPHGVASRYIHDHWKVGDLVNISAPAGKFVFDGSQSSEVLLIAGGVGITPMMSIVRYLTDRAWPGKIHFLVVAKTEADVIFHEEIKGLKRKFPNLHVCITLTRAESESNWMGERGRASEELMKRIVPHVAELPVYLCGPDEMMEATRQVLLRVGVPQDRIQTEAFVSPAVSASDGKNEIDASELSSSGSKSNNGTAAIQQATIVFNRSNVTAQVSSDTSVLECAEAESIDIPFECRSGICGQCKTRLLKGTVYMETEDALSAKEKSSGMILACQARPTSDIVVDA